MSHENVEAFKRGFDAFNRGDIEESTGTAPVAPEIYAVGRDGCAGRYSGAWRKPRKCEVPPRLSRARVNAWVDGAPRVAASGVTANGFCSALTVETNRSGIRIGSGTSRRTHAAALR